MEHPEIRFRPEISSDLRIAFDWYESKQPGLGADFVAEFWSAIGRIEDGPEHYAVARNGFRPCRLRRFPYIIHYRIESTCVLITAVMAAARDDSGLHDRG